MHACMSIFEVSALHFETRYNRYTNFYFKLKWIFSTNYSYKIVYLGNWLQIYQLQSIFNLPFLITRENKAVQKYLFRLIFYLNVFL